MDDAEYPTEHDFEKVFDGDLSSYYNQKWKPIQNNDESFQKLVCHEQIYLSLEVRHWDCLGKFLGGNTHIRLAEFSNCNLCHEKLEVVLSGLKSNTSLQELHLGENEIGGAGCISILTDFQVTKKCALKVLRLNKIGLFRGDADLDALGFALQKSRVELLDLSGNTVGSGTNWHSLNIFFRNCSFSEIDNLILNGCELGREGCKALAQIFNSGKQKLREINLDLNFIDDDCISILTDAISSHNNTSLEKLNLKNNRHITTVGLDHLIQLLCNTTSIQATYNSNHTLKEIEYSGWFTVKYRQALSHLQKLNSQRDKYTLNQIARMKVMNAHFGQGNNSQFDLRPILDLGTKILPHVLGWINKADAVETLGANQSLDRLRVIHRIFRYGSVPKLYNFPSNERVDIDIGSNKMARLEAEKEDLVYSIADLVSRNVDLVSRNTSLMSTNAFLEAKIAALEAKLILKVENESLESKIGGFGQDGSGTNEKGDYESKTTGSEEPLNSIVTALKEENEELKSKLMGLETDTSVVIKKLNNANSVLKIENSKLKKKSKRDGNGKTERKHYEAEIAAMGDKFKMATAALKQENEELKSKWDKFETDKNSTMRKLKKENAVLKKEMSVLKKENSELCRFVSLHVSLSKTAE